MWASWKGYLDIIHILLEYDVNVGEQDNVRNQLMMNDIIITIHDEYCYKCDCRYKIDVLVMMLYRVPYEY